METIIKLNNHTISDLKSMLEICREKSRSDVRYKEYAELIEKIIINKISYIFLQHGK